jgi:hypothetical protein
MPTGSRAFWTGVRGENKGQHSTAFLDAKSRKDIQTGIIDKD